MKFLLAVYLVSIVFFCIGEPYLDFGPGPEIKEIWIEAEGRHPRCGTIVAWTELAFCQLLAFLVCGLWRITAHRRKK